MTFSCPELRRHAGGCVAASAGNSGAIHARRSAGATTPGRRWFAAAGDDRMPSTLRAPRGLCHTLRMVRLRDVDSDSEELLVCHVVLLLKTAYISSDSRTSSRGALRLRANIGRLLHCVVIRIEPLCTSASSARLLPDAAVRCLLSASAPIFHRSGLTVLWRRGLATENRKRAEGDDVLC